MDISEKIQSHWYVLQVMSQQEKRVEKALQAKREEAAREGLDTRIDDVRVPTDMVEVVRTNKKGNEKKVSKEPRIRYLGYVLIQARLYQEDGTLEPGVWDLLKGTQGVIRVIGDDNPVILSESESAAMLRSDEEESIEQKKVKVLFSIGENVVVKTGPFSGYTGVIEAIDNAHARLKVSVELFDRTTSIDIENSGVEKVQA